MEMEEPGTRLSTDSAPPPHPPLVSPSMLPSLSLSSRALYFGFTTSDGASQHFLGEPRHLLPLPRCSSGYWCIRRWSPRVHNTEPQTFPTEPSCQKQRLKMTRPNPVDLSFGAISTVRSCDRHHGTLGFS